MQVEQCLSLHLVNGFNCVCNYIVAVYLHKVYCNSECLCIFSVCVYNIYRCVVYIHLRGQGGAGETMTTGKQRQEMRNREECISGWFTSPTVSKFIKCIIIWNNFKYGIMLTQKKLFFFELAKILVYTFNQNLTYFESGEKEVCHD